MIVLPTTIREAIVAEAREGAPEEICGVLGGEFDEDRSRVYTRYPAENAADRPETRYRLDPEAALEIFERLEGRDQEIVGFYHSHPHGPPEPSATDVESATWPDRSYLIVSLSPLEAGSWRWRGDAFEREEVVLE